MKLLLATDYCADVFREFDSIDAEFVVALIAQVRRYQHTELSVNVRIIADTQGEVTKAKYDIRAIVRELEGNTPELVGIYKL